MTRDDVNSQTVPGFQSRVVAWVKIVAMFVIASGVQVFMYGGPNLWGDERAMFSFVPGLYLPGVLVFFFGPALLAAGLSLRLLRAFYRQQGERVPKRVIGVVAAMAVLSSYAGVFVSFNVWGT